MRLYVVITTRREFNVAAHTAREAKSLVQDRITTECSDARDTWGPAYVLTCPGGFWESESIVTAEPRGSWDADYGTVMCIRNLSA